MVEEWFLIFELMCDLIFELMCDLIFELMCDLIFELMCDLIFELMCDLIFELPKFKFTLWRGGLDLTPSILFCCSCSIFCRRECDHRDRIFV